MTALSHGRLPLWDAGRNYFQAISLLVNGYSNVLLRFKLHATR